MMVGHETQMVDLDVGDIFYNFKLSLVLTKYCGVDLGPYHKEEKNTSEKPYCLLWVIPMMGLILSTYAAIQGLLWASKLVHGDRGDPANPFMWDSVRLHLPGDLY